MRDHPENRATFDELLDEAVMGDCGRPPMLPTLVASLRTRRRRVLVRRASTTVAMAALLALGVVIVSRPFSSKRQPLISAVEQTESARPSALPSALSQATVAAYLPIITARRGDMQLPEDPTIAGAKPESPIRPGQSRELLRGL
ncbi:MAG: hypothetical protein JSR77_06885 [Planctomycetes bacterium]|nr:hypothetical protein [Planctomycetota bacterium]